MAGTTKRILCVDDHLDTRLLILTLLTMDGYAVMTAGSLAEGLRLAKAMSFDLLLLDNWLPDGTGIELCQQIREFDTSTPILFYSAAVFESDRLAALGAGAQAYLAKPAGQDEIGQAITNLLGKDGQRAQVAAGESLKGASAP